MKVLKLLIILISLVLDCNFCYESYRIFNGIKTTINKHPYQVGLMIKFKFKTVFICGGSIINNNTILTAAHCIRDDIPPESYIVKVGSTKYDSGEYFTVKKIITHPEYMEDHILNDIAMLKLEKFLQFNELIQPIDLQPKNKIIPAGTKAITSGWGSINVYKEVMSDELQELEVVVLENSICNIFSRVKQSSKLICALNRGKSICNGDSGGPLVINGKLVGISSFVIINCKGKYPFFFTSVALMRDFIDKNI